VPVILSIYSFSILEFYIWIYWEI